LDDRHGWHYVATHWALWALLAAGLTALAVTQVAYSGGPLSKSMPGLTIGDPVASVLIGITVFHERLATTASAAILGVLAFIVMLVAAVRLAVLEALPAKNA
jgi:glucose uptake protein GlcU